jgi:hypothetical protein
LELDSSSRKELVNKDLDIPLLYSRKELVDTDQEQDMLSPATASCRLSTRRPPVVQLPDTGADDEDESPITPKTPKTTGDFGSEMPIAGHLRDIWRRKELLRRSVPLTRSQPKNIVFN